MAKKIGVISDTHGFLRPEVLEILKSCDCILHAGDICTPDILDQIRPLASLYAVLGNNDRASYGMPKRKTLEFTIEGVRFFLTHNKRDVAWNLGEIQIVIYGHTHQYEQKEIGNRLWLNPGCCGVSRFGSAATMAVIDVENGKYTVKKIVLEQSI